MLLCVILGFFWEILDVNIRRLEAFHALAQPNGARLQDSLSLSYITDFVYFVPFKSCSRRHWAVTMSSTLYILETSVLPLLSSALLQLSPDERSVRINKVFVSLAMVTLAIVIALALTLLFTLQRRRYRLYGDPGSISGNASLLSGSNALTAFRSLRSYDSQATIDRRLKSCRFELVLSGQGYQIQLVDWNPDDLSAPHKPFKQSRREAQSWWLWRRSYLGLTLLAALPQLYIQFSPTGLIPLNYYATQTSFTFLSTLSASVWQNWQHHVATCEPYASMKGHKEHVNYLTPGNSYKFPTSADPNGIALDYPPVSILSTFYAMEGQTASGLVGFISFCAFWYQFQVALNSVAIDIYLKAEITGLFAITPHDVKSWLFFRGCALLFLAFSLAALFVMLLSETRKPFMPRKPWTLSSKILYICHSEGLLEDVKGMSMMNKGVRHRKLRAKGSEGMYRFGWFRKKVDGDYEGESGEWIVGVERASEVQKRYSYGETQPRNTSEEKGKVGL